MMVLDDAGIDQLYVEPGLPRSRDRRTAGGSSRRSSVPGGLELYTFQVNDRARRFYERHGFRSRWFGDGTGNEEGQPDVLYRWRP